MDKKEILAFINNNPTTYFATVEGNKPHVRGMGLYKADEDGIIFQTSEPKDMHKQLMKNPETELCFHNVKDSIQVRVSGRMEPVEDLDLKKEVVAKRPFLKDWVDKNGYGFIKLYRMRKGKAFVWTFATNFDPKKYIEL